MSRAPLVSWFHLRIHTEANVHSGLKQHIPCSEVCQHWQEGSRKSKAPDRHAKGESHLFEEPGPTMDLGPRKKISLWDPLLLSSYQSRVLIILFSALVYGLSSIALLWKPDQKPPRVLFFIQIFMTISQTHPTVMGGLPAGICWRLQSVRTASASCCSSPNIAALPHRVATAWS